MTRLSELHLRKSNLAMDLFVLTMSATPLFHDWKVVLLFYSTLHRVQEYAALRGDELPRSHDKRWDYINKNLPEVIEAYHALYCMSITARYDPSVEITGDWVRHARELRAYVLSAIT